MCASDVTMASAQQGLHRHPHGDGSLASRPLRTTTQRGMSVCVSLCLALLTALPAHAQSDKDAEQLKRLRLQLRQVQQQSQSAQSAQAQADQARTQAEQALKKQEGELDRERAAAGNASRRAASVQKELSTLQADHQRVTAELAAVNEQLKALQASSRSAQQTAQTNEATLRTRSDQLTAQLDRCTGHNAELVQLGQDLWGRYENKGLGEVLGANEPFFQTARVKLENLQAEYARRIQNADMARNPRGGAVVAPASGERP